jgi:hypothetical protein
LPIETHGFSLVGLAGSGHSGGPAVDGERLFFCSAGAGFVKGPKKRGQDKALDEDYRRSNSENERARRG